jgi:type VI secretion system protein ImpC
MPKASTLADVEMDIEVGKKRIDTTEDPERPFRILLIGDFSGRASRGVSQNLAGRKPVMIDRDNFDQVMEKYSVDVHLPVERGEPIALRFRELDDFHPDRLYNSLKMFHDLRDLRDTLEDPAAFKAAAAKLRPTPQPPRPSQPQKPEIPDLVSGNLLDQIAAAESEGTGTAARSRRAVDPIRAYVNEIVAPYLTPNPDPKQKELIGQVDSATSGQMSAVLHHPIFQATEAAWRALYFLVRDIETSVQLKIYVLDATRDEVAADLSVDDLRASALHKLLVEETVQTLGGQPWAVIGANFTFGPSIDDVELLAKLGMLARGARAPFLAAGHSKILGCESIVSTPHPREWRSQPIWDEVRQFPEAAWVGLTLPRFLLRLPYGKATDSIESFVFEEMPGKPRHDDYLWGNTAFLAVALIAQAFSQFGWQMRAGAIQNVRGLPLHIYKEDGDSVAQPCAEVLLTEQAATTMIDRGLMPLLSMKGTDTVRLGMFQSVAGKSLPGRWQA